MIRDLLAGLGSLLLSGPILALLLLVYSIVLGGICYWRGRLTQAGVEKRQRVRDAYDAATAARLADLLPEQRGGSE